MHIIILEDDESLTILSFFIIKYVSNKNQVIATPAIAVLDPINNVPILTKIAAINHNFFL